MLASYKGKDFGCIQRLGMQARGLYDPRNELNHENRADTKGNL